jgi:glyoxylase-like metal-dependent hydrolase (beta-lactamase superfamily II)
LPTEAQIKIGAVDVAVVSDGSWRSDGGAMFGVVPRVLWQRKLPPDDLNRVTLALRCLLIRVAGTTILVDAGMGDKLGDKDRELFGVERPVGLLRELAQLGVEPGDVDVVVDTHLHLDHAGGNTTRQGERLVPTFPRAEYWVQRREWDDATHPNERTRVTYLAENLLPLADTGRLRFFDGEAEIAPGVQWLPAPGHTRAHTCVLVESGGQSALFPVDVCPFVAHLERLAWVPAVDTEPLVSMETKRRLISDIIQNDRLVIFDHDPNVVAARLKGTAEKWVVEPVVRAGEEGGRPPPPTPSPTMGGGAY